MGSDLDVPRREEWETRDKFNGEDPTRDWGGRARGRRETSVVGVDVNDTVV